MASPKFTKCGYNYLHPKDQLEKPDLNFVRSSAELKDMQKELPDRITEWEQNHILRLVIQYDCGCELWG